MKLHSPLHIFDFPIFVALSNPKRMIHQTLAHPPSYHTPTSLALTVGLKLFINRRKGLFKGTPPPPIVNNFTGEKMELASNFILRTDVHEYFAHRHQAMPAEFRNARFRQPHRMLRPVRTVTRPPRILVRVSQWLPDPLEK
jgi:hypothetical protein